MLRAIRNNKTLIKFVLRFLAVILVLAFGVFGTAYQMDSKKDNPNAYAGKVFGRKIPFKEYQTQWMQMEIVDKMNYKNDFGRVRQILEQDRGERAWLRMILLKEADKHGIKVSDEEVVKYIQDSDAFQVDQKFNQLLYQDRLRNFFRVQARDFEECFRDKLKIDKLSEQETAGITVSDEEAREAYKQNNDKLQVSYVLFANEDFKGEITDDEAKIREYYENHKEAFAVPPMINVEFVRFNFPTKSKSEDKENAGELSEADKDAAWDQANEVYQVVKKPDANFGQIIQDRGLKLEESGFFSMEQPNLKAGWSFPVIQKIFGLKPGQISDPVETADGYQILRVKESKPAEMPPFEEVQEKVAAEWKLQQASGIAKLKAEQALKKIREALAQNQSADFKKVAKDMGLELTQTSPFGRGDYLPKLGMATEFQDKAFMLNSENPLSDVTETSKGYCLIHLDSRTEADMAEFEKEKEKYRSALLLDKKRKVMMDFLARLRNKADLEVYLPTQEKTAQN